MNAPRCDLCKHYEKDRGECRANPPIMLAVAQAKLAGAPPVILGGFPHVAPDAWCARHTPGSTESATSRRPVLELSP